MFPMLRIPITTASRNYEAVIEHGLLSRAGEILRDAVAGNPPAFVITVPPVRRRWGKVLLKSLAGAGFTATFVEMPDGERFKRLSSIEKLAEDMLKLGADRKAVVIAFGGGVVGDVAGMLASVYMRGVQLVQIPTTVQAQLDAAIGGKTGVNLKSGKNLLGTFYQPAVVLIDLIGIDHDACRMNRIAPDEAASGRSGFGVNVHRSAYQHSFNGGEDEQEE